MEAGKTNKNAKGARKEYAVLCAFGVLAAADEWMSLKNRGTPDLSLLRSN